MLTVNLRHLETHEQHLKGELPPGELELDLHDEVVRATQPLHYDLEVEKLHDAVLVQGKLDIALDCECVRCLKSFKKRLVLERWALHLPLEGEDKATVDNDCIDLTPYVREDILLEFPQHPLCKPECRGLKEISEKSHDENESAWSKLNKLKL
ncbi:MAG TPA: YceD family protein [Verrucomicrobiae bacterium]|jgi:uncharacterized protein